MQAPPTLRLHHIGFLTADLGAAADHFSKSLGYCVESEPIEDRLQKATVQFLRMPAAGHWLELISPLGEDSSLRKALQKGQSLHHHCYETADIIASMKHLRQQSYMPIGIPQPGAAFDSRPIAWLMDPYNSLVELVEAGSGARSLSALDRADQEKCDA